MNILLITIFGIIFVFIRANDTIYNNYSFGALKQPPSRASRPAAHCADIRERQIWPEIKKPSRMRKVFLYA